MFLWMKEKRPVPTGSMKNACTKNLALQIDRGNLRDCLKTSVLSMLRWNRATCGAKQLKHTHTVKEWFVPEENRDIASFNADNEFNRAIDEENIDFNIPGVPNSTVKRSHGVKIQNLIQKIDSDLQQHRQFNHFSKESQDVIKADGNTELCELLDGEPKAQCKACLGIVYCTCGHFLRDDTTENKKYIKSVLDLFSIPNYYIRKGHRHGKKEGDQEFHTANQLQKKCKKRQFLSIHDRFIRDTWFRKTMPELGRTEEVIREMDKLVNEDHTHIVTEEELNVYRSNWWIRSNFVGSDTKPIRHRPDFKEALSTLRRLKNAEDQAYYQNWWQSSSSSWWQWQDSWWHPSSETLPRRLNTDGAGEPAKISEWSIYLWNESQDEFGAKVTVTKFGTSQRSLLSPTGGVKSIPLLQKTGYGNNTNTARRELQEH